MTDVNCLLAGLVRLLGPVLLLFIWHKKTRARLFPALAALLICFPVFFIAAVIRSGFSHSSWPYYIQQALLYGIFEETAKYLVLRYMLTSYDSRKDAVTYGIGHSAFEEIGAAMACFGLIGTGRADPYIFLFNLFALIEGTAFVVALTVIIFYGISTDRSKITLPAAIFLHFIGNLSQGVLIEPAAIAVNVLLTAGECFAAYRCYQAMNPPFDEKC